MTEYVIAAIGQRLLATRSSKGMTMTQVADLAGLSIPTVSRIEAQRSGVPNIETIVRLSIALGCKVSDIVPSPRECLTFLQDASAIADDVASQAVE